MHILLFGRKQQHLLFPSLIAVFCILCLNSALVPQLSAQAPSLSEVGGNGRDFRSRQSGNWSDPATWQVFRSGVWVNADAAGGLVPTASSNVFIESRHVISATRASIGAATFDGKIENAFVECNNLNISTTFATITTTWANFDMSGARPYPAHELRIYGKLRSYIGDAINRTDISLPVFLNKSSVIGAGSTLVFRGASRIITQPQQWSTTEAPVYTDAAAAGHNGFFTAIFELGVMPSGDVTNLDDDPSGAVGTIQGNFVAGHIIVKRGTVRVEGDSFLANEGYTTSGTIHVMNNAVLQLASANIIARTVSLTNAPGPPFAPASRLRSFVVEDGGAVEFTNTVGTINAADVRFNGTVIYSRTGDQNLLQRSTLLPSGENGDANDPYRQTSAVENYSSLTLRGSGLKAFPSGITVSRVLLMQGTAKATGQQVRFLRSTGVADAVWSVNGGNTARIVNLGFRTASLLGGITLSRSTNREQIDLTPPQTPLVDATLQSASNLIVAAPNTPYDTPINTSATTTLQYDSEQSDIMDNVEFPSGVQGPHNLVINVNSNVSQVIRANTMVIQGPEYTTNLNGHLPRVINGGVAASAYVDTRPNLMDSRSVTAEGLIPAALSNGGLRPLVPIPFATSDGRVRRFEDGGRRGDINNFGVIELRRGNLNLRNSGSTLILSTTAIISPDMSKARNPQAGSDDATQKRGPAGPDNLAGSLVGGSLASLVFNGGTALYPVQDNFNTGFTEIAAPMGVRGTTGYAPSTSTGRFNLGPEVVSTVEADGTVRRANNSYNVDLPYIRSGVEHLTMIRATSNVLTLLGNQENIGNSTTFSSPELAGLQVYGTIATARGSIDLNGRNIEMGGNNSFLVEAYSKVQITNPATGRTLGTLTPFSSHASTVRNTNSAKAYIGLTSPRNVVAANAPIGIDAVNEDVSGLGMQIYQNGNPLQLRVRRWQTNKDNTIQLGQGIQAANRYYEIEKSGTLVQQISRADARFQYVEEDLNGAPEDSLLLLRSGTINSSWTAIDNARSVIRLDPAQFFNQLTALQSASTLNFEDATARFWAMGASARSTSVRLHEETPRAVALTACYPNPAQDVAHIRYVVREAAVPLEIALYDLTGRKLATLLQSVHSTGDYTLEVRTEHLSSGVYVIRLQAPNTTTQELLRVVK